MGEDEEETIEIEQIYKSKPNAETTKTLWFWTWATGFLRFIDTNNILIYL